MVLPTTLLIGNKGIPKNNYHDTFLAYIYPALERNRVIFYPFNCITKLKYHLFRPASKSNLFT